MSWFKRKPKPVREKVQINLGVRATADVKLLADDLYSLWKGTVRYVPVLQVNDEEWLEVSTLDRYEDTYLWTSGNWFDFDTLILKESKSIVCGIDRAILHAWQTYLETFKTEIDAAVCDTAKSAMLVLEGRAKNEMDARKNFWEKLQTVLLKGDAVTTPLGSLEAEILR
jgi:hypothetical protein